MSDVRDEVLVRRLADLGEDGLRGTGLASPAEMWERGLRYRRRRRRGTAVVVAATVLALGGLLSLVEVQRPDPAPVAPAESSPALPDRTWEPSPWLPGTDDLGPPGPLAMVIEADRGGWPGGHRGLVGVSAATGEYRFLDLPDRATDGGGFALSPDGRRVAYWATGETAGTPHTLEGPGGPAVGAAVYDTTTGEVSRLDIPTRHGLSTENPLWVGGRLVLSSLQWRAGHDGDEMLQGSANRPETRIWDPTTGDVESLGDAVDAGWATASGELLLASVGSGHVLADLGTRPVTLGRLRFDRPSSSRAVVDAGGRRIALVPGNRSPGPLSAGLALEGRVSLSRVPGRADVRQPLAWIDDSTVGVTLLDTRTRSGPAFRLAVIDTVDGSRRVVTELAGPVSGLWGQWVATDLLGQPTRAGVEPPRPWDPRVTTGSGVLLLGGGVGAVVWWRRRVEP